jgi:hypothetical protein
MADLASLAETARFLGASAARTEKYAKLSTKLHVILDREAGMPEGVDCKPGCDHCCHRFVEGTLPEVLEVAAFVGSDEGFIERLAVYEAELETYLWGKSLGFHAACPFLVDGLCSVYEVRPLACRALWSSDVRACEGWRFSGEKGPFLKAPMDMANALKQGSLAGLAGVGGPFDLPGAVGAVLRGEPVDRFSSRSVASLPASESEFSRLVDKPLYFELWSAALSGDRATISRLEPVIDDPIARELAALSLPALYESQDEVEENWGRLTAGVERFVGLDLEPLKAFERLPFLSTFRWAYAGKDVRPVIEQAIGKIARDVVGRAYPELVSPLPVQRKPGRFRLGYLSPRMNNFNGSKWARGWIAHQSPEIETFVFNFDAEEDIVTAHWKRLADHFYHLPVPIPTAAEFIRGLDLDALIFTDLTMGKLDHQISSMRLARRQFNAWGHPVTSGSPTIEGYLSSDLMEPVGADEHYTETLYRLPGSGLCYPRTVRDPADVDLGKFGLPESGFFFQAQMAHKGLPKHDVLFREICERTGKPIAFLEPAQPYNREKFRKRLAAAGAKAVILPFLSGDEYWGVMAKADAILDTPDWNGGNSTIDALELGKPVISVAGEFMRGRHSLAFLTQAGVSGLIAKDLADYVELACDVDRQGAAMERLNAAGIFEDVEPVRMIEEILLSGR